MKYIPIQFITLVFVFNAKFIGIPQYALLPYNGTASGTIVFSPLYVVFKIAVILLLITFANAAVDPVPKFDA